MSIATISSKGQITLPVQVRRKLGIGPHDRVLIEANDDAIVIRRAPDLFELEGFLGKSLPREEEREKMMRGVAEHVKGRR